MSKVVFTGPSQNTDGLRKVQLSKHGITKMVLAPVTF